MNSQRPPNARTGSVRRCVQFALFRDGWFSVRELIPNFFTLLSICCGLLAIRWAIEREFEWSMGAIIAAVVLDGIDGRAARILDAQSKFGAEFDSLADFVSFGVAPAILLFNWGLGHMSGVGWAAVTMLTLACGVRLARFNATIERKRHAWEQNYLTGVPAPAGAVLALLPMYLDGLRSAGEPALPGFAPQPLWITWTIVAYVVTIAFLMVSTIPTFAGKKMGDRIASEYPLVLLGSAIGATALLFAYPYATLASICVVYLLSMPFGVRRYLQLEKPGSGADGSDGDISEGVTRKAGE
jgi:CDP-diacylglycerol--serine O-phosphatidyltransferase